MKKILISTVLSSALLFGAYDSVGTDYEKAVSQSWTQENTLSALETVNMILGFIRDSRASDFINKGNYKALLKDEDKEGSAKQAGTTSTTVEKLMPMTLNVTRDINNTSAPMYVKLWLDTNGPNDVPMRVVGHMTVEKGVSDEYPLGDFTFQFGGYLINKNGDINVTNPNKKVMSGVMDITKADVKGQAKVEYKNSMMGGAEEESIHMILNVNATDANNDGDKTDDGEEQGNGVAYTKVTSFQDNNSTLKAYKLSLSKDFYRVQEVDATSGANMGDSTVKEKAVQLHKVYRYGVYHDSNGSKVKMNSGFPIASTTSNAHGYIGYWGLWSENDLLKNGDVVKKEGAKDNATYTIMQSEGKLKKYTKDTTTLAKIHNTKLFYYDNSTNQQYILTWDKNAGGGNGNFKILGTQNNYGEAQNVANVSGKYLFNTAGDDNSTNPITLQEWSGAWSEALNAQLSIKSTLTNDTNVSYHKEEVVVPTSNMTLYHFGNTMINPNMDKSNTSTINQTAAIQAWQTPSIIGAEYKFSANNYMLTDANDTNITVPSDVNFSTTQYGWWENGAQFGPFLDTNSTKYNAFNFWDVDRNESVYYKWETGKQNWNKFTSIKDSTGKLITFDPPKNFNYEHTTANDLNSDTNNTGMYSLQYDGYSLQVPWKYDDKNGWVPKINIKSGTAVTDSNGAKYRLKVLEEGIMIGDAKTYQGKPAIIIPSDLNSSYMGPDHNGTLIQNLGDVPKDANVTVIKGVCVKDNCEL